jgi:hypothetical protein
MRRIWAPVLVANFGFALIGLATLTPSGDRKPPQCCRKNGKHHCAAPQHQGGSSGQNSTMLRYRFHEVRRFIKTRELERFDQIPDFFIAETVHVPAGVIIELEDRHTRRFS